MRRYRAGEHLLVRHVLAARVLQAVPARVVQADSRAVATWIARGTPIAYPEGQEQGRLLPLERWEIRRRSWFGNGCLDLTPFGRAHMVRLFWTDEGAFRGWYVNLQEPLRPTRRGFDTQDHQLDLWIEPDGQVQWKDEDHVEQAVELGIMSLEQARSARREAERVLAEWPFPTGFEQFRPDPAWPLPDLPDDWHVV